MRLICHCSTIISNLKIIIAPIAYKIIMFDFTEAVIEQFAHMKDKVNYISYKSGNLNRKVAVMSHKLGSGSCYRLTFG